ncbi:MAG: transporter substrate-binding domain-containing protein [Coprococcus sp.]
MEEHGNIRIGFQSNDPAVFSMDEETGKLTGMLAEYVSYAKDCLGNQKLEFNIQEYNDYDEMIQALQEREIDMIFIPAEILFCRRKRDMHLQTQPGLTA